jgi:hypothetical protein
MLYEIVKRRDKYFHNNDFSYSHIDGEKYPLCCLTEYTDEIQKDDIIGVVFRETTQRTAMYKISHSLFIFNYMSYDDEKCLSDKYPLEHYYTHSEEHLFKVTNVKNNKEYEIEPYYLHNDCVIHNVVDEKTYRDKKEYATIDIPKNIIIEYYIQRTYCIYNNYEIDDNYCVITHENAITLRKIGHVFDNLETIDHLNILKDIKNLNLSNDFIYTLENVYEIAIKTIGKTISFDTLFYYRKEASLNKPEIIYPITSVSYENIMRVYKDDKHSSCVHEPFVILDNYPINTMIELPRDMLTLNVSPLNINVRIRLKCKKYETRVYVTLIYKMNDEYYLGSILNFHSTETENNIIPVHVNSIFQIDRDQHEKVMPYLKDIIDLKGIKCDCSNSDTYNNFLDTFREKNNVNPKYYDLKYIL